ncbi:hypothetical protein [Pseudoalteromonas sp. M58]|uniref:hypothetical protein n=1 Tax=Pseudoalteromonas sp. M58 TaxID=3141534 RepID=UPI0036735E64
MILAIPAAAPAIPPNPKTAAISAITKNVIVQRNIVISLIYLSVKVLFLYKRVICQYFILFLINGLTYLFEFGFILGW